MSTTAPDQSLASAAGELEAIRLLLGALLAANRYEALQIIVGNFDYRESVLSDSPATQGKRLIVPRYGAGSDGLQTAAIGATPVEVLEKNEGRIGGLIVNYGASPCFLYLATLGDIQGGQRGNRPSVWLGANGGAWDFRLASALYGGTVCAAAPVGSASLTIAEF